MEKNEAVCDVTAGSAWWETPADVTRKVVRKKYAAPVLANYQVLHVWTVILHISTEIPICGSTGQIPAMFNLRRVIKLFIYYEFYYFILILMLAIFHKKKLMAVGNINLIARNVKYLQGFFKFRSVAQ